MADTIFMHHPILDETGTLVELPTVQEESEWKHMHGFAAPLLPITYRLPVVDGGKRLCIVYYLFENENRPDALHIYAKSVIYAYRQLLRHTDIAEVGSVRIMASPGASPVVRRYLEAAGLEALFIPDVPQGVPPKFSNKQFAFFHEAVSAYDYVYLMDCDTWAFSLGRTPVLSWASVLHRFEEAGAELMLFGQARKRTHSQKAHRPNIFVTDFDEVAHKVVVDTCLMSLVGTSSPEMFQVKGVGICLKMGGPAWQALRTFHADVHEVFVDDEAVYGLFLETHPYLSLAPVWDRKTNPYLKAQALTPMSPTGFVCTGLVRFNTVDMQEQVSALYYNLLHPLGPAFSRKR